MRGDLAARCVCQLTEAKLGGLVWTASWLRAAEPAAAASLGIDLSKLMIQAGTAAYKDCVKHYGESARHWVILAGAGNNGGDGYVMARLAKADGRRVTVLSMPHNRPLPPEAANAQSMWHAEGGTEAVLSEDTVLPTDADLLVDGLLGTGMAGAPRGLCASVIEKANCLPVHRFAIDIPSGLDAETGAAPGACFLADHTITFISLKPGLLTGKARSYVGQLTYNTLGLDRWLAAPEQLSHAHGRRLTWEELPGYYGRRRSATAHKGSSGSVLLIGGASGFGGAILMAAEASLVSGAGLTRVLTDKEHITALLNRCPEAMYVAADTSSAANEEQLRGAMDWADVLAVGPGLGQGPFGRSVVTAALLHAAAHPRKTLVLDADALNLLPASLSAIPSPVPLRIPRSILTPHPGEAARLLRSSVAEVERDRFHAARDLAAVLGGVCVLKGPGSIIYQHPNDHAGEEHMFTPGNCAILDAGNAGMATGGMGDVLTGVVAAVAAQRLAGDSPFDAASAAALAHSVAADLAVEGRGTRGLRATELLPHVLRCVNAGGASSAL